MHHLVEGKQRKAREVWNAVLALTASRGDGGRGGGPEAHAAELTLRRGGQLGALRAERAQDVHRPSLTEPGPRGLASPGTRKIPALPLPEAVTSRAQHRPGREGGGCPERQTVGHSFCEPKLPEPAPQDP